MRKLATMFSSLLMLLLVINTIGCTCETVSTPTPIPMATATPTPTQAPSPTPTMMVTHTPKPSPTTMPTPTPILTPKPLPTTMPTPTPTTTPKPIPTPTPKPADITIDYPISASVSAIAPDRAITVYSATRTSSYPLMTGEVVTAPSGCVFIILQVTAMNIGKATISIKSSDFKLSDSQGHTVKAQVGGRPYYVGDPFGAVLAPSEIDSGKLLYVVPSQASGFELSYLLEPASVPRVIARWKLNY